VAPRRLRSGRIRFAARATVLALLSVYISLCSAFPGWANADRRTAEDPRGRAPTAEETKRPVRFAQAGVIPSIEGDWIAKETGETLHIEGSTWLHPSHGRARVREANDAADIKVYYDNGNTCAYRVTILEKGNQLDLIHADNTQNPDYCPSGALTRVSAPKPAPAAPEQIIVAPQQTPVAPPQIIVAPQQAPAQQTPVLSGVPQQADASRAIQRMTEQGIMSVRALEPAAAAEANSFGEFLVSVQRMFNLPPSDKPVVFTDVPPGSPYYDAVQATAPYLGRQALCFGCALSTNLYPNQQVSRALTTLPLVNILISRGAIELLDEQRAAEVLSSVSDVPRLQGPLGRYLATAISAHVLYLTQERKMEIGKSQTRSDIAITLDSVQTEYSVPQVRSR